MVGVMRLEGSLTRSRVKFCDSATMRPASQGALPEALVSPCDDDGDARQFSGLVLVFILAVALVVVGIEVADESAFDDGANAVMRRELRCLRHATKAKLRMLLRFQRAHGGAGELAQIGGGKILGFASAKQEQAFGFQSGGMMQQRGLEGLAGHFAAGDNIFGGGRHGSVGGSTDGAGLSFSPLSFSF